MLKTQFVTVAVDQWYTRQKSDDEGLFYQKIAKQGPRKDMDLTTQGFYVCDAAGTLLGYSNNRVDLDRVRKILREGLAGIDTTAKNESIKSTATDAQYDRTPPKGTLTVRVNTKILGGYDKPVDDNDASFQRAIARDNLWILADEQEALASGTFPDSLAKRIARFHLIDNTRGEPLMWTDEEIKTLDMKIEDGVVTGRVKIVASDPKRGYEAALRGKLVVENKTIKQFDVVAKGLCYGNGPWTKFGPKGKFPLAVAFRLADGTDIADSVAPQGTKGWKEGYLVSE